MSKIDPSQNRTTPRRRSIALAALCVAGLQGFTSASPQERALVLALAPAPLDPVHAVVQELARLDVSSLDVLAQRWQELPTAFQLRLPSALSDIDLDDSIWVLVGMVASDDQDVRSAAGDALRAETGLYLPDSSEHWSHWLEGEEIWLRVRAEALIRDLRGADEARVVAATHEIALHQIHRRDFARELERNLGRISPAIRSVTSRALGELGHAGSRAALQGASTDPAAAVRREATAALKKLPSPDRSLEG